MIHRYRSYEFDHRTGVFLAFSLQGMDDRIGAQVATDTAEFMRDQAATAYGRLVPEFTHSSHLSELCVTIRALADGCEYECTFRFTSGWPDTNEANEALRMAYLDLQNNLNNFVEGRHNHEAA